MILAQYGVQGRALKSITTPCIGNCKEEGKLHILWPAMERWDGCGERQVWSFQVLKMLGEDLLRWTALGEQYAICSLLLVPLDLQDKKIEHGAIGTESSYHCLS